jgi:hypothetical protein
MKKILPAYILRTVWFCALTMMYYGKEQTFYLLSDLRCDIFSYL